MNLQLSKQSIIPRSQWPEQDGKVAEACEATATKAATAAAETMAVVAAAAASTVTVNF